MSDEINNGSDDSIQAPDPIKGIETKLSNTEKHLESLYASQKAIVDALNTLNTPKQSHSEQVEDHSISDLIISNPDLAVKKITESVKKQVNQELNSQSARAAEETRVLNEMRSEFPELSDMSHPLTKAALEIYDRMPNKDKESPLAYKAAIQEAAIRNGVRPKSQRSQSDDDFSLGQRGSGRIPKGEKVDNKTLEFAKLMGLDVSDKGTVERLKKYSTTDFNRFNPLD